MKERKIAWESYHLEDPEYSERDKVLKDLDEEDEEEYLMAEEVRNAPTLMETPFGLIEKNDRLNPFNQLDFWMINANFNIRAKEFIIINFHEGVEAVKPISRYRILVAFGKMFIEDKDNPYQEVKKSLENALININDYPHELYLRQRRTLVQAQNN